MRTPNYELAAYGITVRSSVDEIDAALRKAGFFNWPHDYVKDTHFERYVLPLGIRTMEDVNRLVEQLENECSDKRFKCSKAHSARHWLLHTGGDSFQGVDWAIISLARARRTQCSCHEEGSFKAKPQANSTQKKK